MHRVLLLGTFGIEGPGGLVVGHATQRRPVAVLAALAVAGARGCTREQLATLLWAECDDTHARHHLSDAIYAVHSELGPQAVEASPALVRLGPACTSDVAEFRAALAAGDREAAVALYRGPFLEGFHVPGSREFEEWLGAERQRLRAQLLDALEALAHSEEVQGHARAAITWWESLVQEDPFNTRFAVSLARAYSSAGNRARAIRQLEEHRRLLREELGVDTGQDLRLALEGVRAGNGNGGTIATRVSPPAAVALPTPAPAEPSLPTIAAAVPHRWRTALQQHWRLALGLVAGVALLALTASIVTDGGVPSDQLDPDVVAIPPFVVVGVRDGAVWSEGLPNLLQGKLEGAGRLRVAAPALVAAYGSVQSADEAGMRRLAGDVHAGLVLAGTAVRSGDGVRAYVAIYDAQVRRRLFEYDLIEDETRLDRLADAIAVRLLTDLVRTRDLATARFTSLGSTSPTAIKAFLRGEQHLRRLQLDSAHACYDLALTTDSTFALAWRGLAETRVQDLLRPPAAPLLRAGALNHGLAVRESLLLAADSLAGAIVQQGGRPNARWASRLLATLEEAAPRHPEDADVWYRLGKARLLVAPQLKLDLDSVRAPLARAIGLDSTLGAAYLQLARVDLLRQRPDLARQSITTLVSFGPSGTTGAGLRLLERLLTVRAQGAGTRDLLDTLRAPLGIITLDAEARAVVDSLIAPQADTLPVARAGARRAPAPIAAAPRAVSLAPASSPR